MNGEDDGGNKRMSQARFAIWRALRTEGIEMPHPHRVIEPRGAKG